MNFREKKNAHDRLLGVTHLEADREFLHKQAPQHNALKRGIFNRLDYASTLLWALLDYVSEADVIAYRREYCAAQAKQELPTAVADTEDASNASGQAPQLLSEPASEETRETDSSVSDTEEAPASAVADSVQEISEEIPRAKKKSSRKKSNTHK